MADTVNVGIIGAGRIGRLHTEHLAFRIPEARVLAVSDIFPEAAKKCAADFNIKKATADHRAEQTHYRRSQTHKASGGNGRHRAGHR